MFGNGNCKGKESDRLVVKAFLHLLPIQILSIVCSAVNGFIDSLVTSRYLGTEALAAIGYFGPVATLIGVCWVIITGIQILCSQAIGTGDRDHVVSLFSTGVLFLSILSLLATGICIAFRAPLAHMLGARGETAELLSGYILGYVPGIIGQVLSSILMVFLPFNNDTKRSYLGIGIMVLSNVGMDLLNALVLHWGCFGMGLATAISYLLSSAVMFMGFKGEDRTIHLRLTKLCLSELPHAAFLGLSALMFNLGCTAKAYIINLSLMNQVGDTAVAVINIQNNLIATLGAIPMGTANTLLTLGSLYVGDEDRPSFISVTRFALRAGILVSLLTALLMMASAPFFPSVFFTRDNPAWDIARQMLLLFPSWLVLNLLLTVILRVYQCQERMVMVNVLTFAENVGIALIAAGLAARIGSDGVWLSYSICDAVLLVIILVSVFQRSEKATFSLEDWMKLSPDFGAKPEECMEFNIRSMEDVINISEKVIDFCKARGIDPKRTMVAGLAVEEMAGNVVEHGFRQGEKHTVDIRVVSKDRLTIRIRDDCRAFDPQKRMQQFTPEDPAKNVGIRMIAGMAEEMSYQNNAGINTLLIKI